MEIKGNFLELLRDYVADREQITNINGILSSVGKVSHGVPQGSTLGPTLFSAYMNDLKQFIKNMYIKM